MNKALDTNIISYLLNQKVYNLNLHNRFRKELQSGTDLFIPSIVHYEILRGYRKVNAFGKLKRYKEFINEYLVIDFTEETAELSAEIHAYLSNQGKIVEDNDLLIGAICVEHDLTLVTHNTKHFENIPGIKLENWVES